MTAASTLPCALPGSPLDAERAGLDACVHCGFCLSSCPTYVTLEDENDSPRGRLVLMRALLDGRIAPTDEAMQHVDRCLGCRACETACPSGVPYGRLLEATRATIVTARPLGFVARVVLAVFAREWLLRPALLKARVIRALGIAEVLARVLPPPLAMPFAMLASTARQAKHDWQSDTATTRERVALLTGCVMEGLFTEVNRATERTLRHNGYRVVEAPGQVCCGALHAHAGDAESARELAKANIAAFEASGAERIAMNSAGCGAMCREYGHLLADDPRWAARAAAFSARVCDSTELLAAAGPRPARGVVADASLSAEEGSAPLPVAWDAPCHLEHAQRVVEPPLHVLRAVGSIALQPLAGANECCGSAGIFSLTQPAVSEAVLAGKLAQIQASGAAVVATANPGCLMQIGGGLLLAGRAVEARHPVELLDAAYADEARTR